MNQIDRLISIEWLSIVGLVKNLMVQAEPAGIQQ
jgi:hypothetical protein